MACEPQGLRRSRREIADELQEPVGITKPNRPSYDRDGRIKSPLEEAGRSAVRLQLGGVDYNLCQRRLS